MLFFAVDFSLFAKSMFPYNVSFLKGYSPLENKLNYKSRARQVTFSVIFECQEKVQTAISFRVGVAAFVINPMSGNIWRNIRHNWHYDRRMRQAVLGGG